MNKHGALSAVVTAIIIIAFLLVVLVYFLWPDAILPKAAQAADQIADNTLSGLKKDKFDKVIVETDKNAEEMYGSLVNNLRSQGNGPCILSHKPLAGDFKGFKIMMSEDPQGIFIRLENNKKQVISPVTISGKKPCVVGEGSAAQNFYDNYLKGKKCESNCLNDYSTASLEIQDSGSIIVNGKKRSLDDGNLLFKTKDGNICFFPTYFGWFTWPGCSADESGLKSNCIDKIKEKIPQCA